MKIPIISQIIRMLELLLSHTGIGGGANIHEFE